MHLLAYLNNLRHLEILCLRANDNRGTEKPILLEF